MSNTVVVPTSRPLPGPNGTFTRVVLREPTVLELIRHEFATMGEADGSRFVVEDADEIEALLKLCIVEPENPMLVLGAQDVGLARRLKQALFGFFHSAGGAGAAAGDGSTTSPTTSSSPATGPSTPNLSIG